MFWYTTIMEADGYSPETSPRDHFKQQFARKEVIQTSAGPTKIVDIRPVFQKDTVPILFAPGWGGTPQAYKECLKIIHDGNRRVLSVSHPRRGKSVAEETDFPMAETRKVQSLISIIDQKNLGKVDVIAHSEGAIYTIIAAALYPEKFRNIVLVNPGGLIGQDKFDKLVGRMLVSAVHDITQAMKNSREKGPLTNAAKEIVKYFAKNPKRAIEELSAIAKSDILEMIKNLHDGGIGIAIVQGEDDPIFPISRIGEVLKDSKDSIDGFYPFKGGHNKIITDARCTSLALNALDDLRHRHQ
mgnify:CR=1 FL=1